MLPYFGDNLKSLLSEHEIDGMELIRKTSLPKAIVYDTLNNKKVPNIKSILVLCKFFNCSIDYLIGRTLTYSPMPPYEPLPFKEVYEKQNKIKPIVKNQIKVKTGIEPISIDRWIKGINKPSTESLIKLADYFGCSVDYLVGIER